MAQAAANPTTSLSRRAVVGIAAGLMLPADAGSAERRDPIFRAIARHKFAEDELEALLVKSDDAGIPVDSRHPTWRRVSTAAVALLSVVPTTPGGIAALLWYVHNNAEQGNSLSTDVFLRNVRRAAMTAFKQAA